MSMVVEFRLLGPLEIVVDGQEVTIGAGKVRIILAVLLLNAGKPVSTEELIDSLWDEDPPQRAKVSLHTYVRRLRQALGPAAGLLRTVPGGYTFDVAAGQVDVLRFKELLDRSRVVGADPHSEADCLYDAIMQWRGHKQPLEDIPSAKLQREVAPMLKERGLEAMERLFDLVLAMGRQAEVLSELLRFTADYPLRERFWGQLMLALHYSDRQADALEAYRKVTRILADELGIDPSPELKRLHQRILTGEAGTPPPRSEPPRRPVWTVRNLLPPDTDGPADRGADLTAAEALLDGRDAVVVLTGPAGAGKTALAVHLAHRLRARFPDGQWYAPLSGAGDAPRDPTDVLAELLHASGLAPADTPDGLPARTAALRARLPGRRVLLLLDGAVDADRVRAVLAGCPVPSECTVLITSRAPLDLPGAKILPLEPYRVPVAATPTTAAQSPPPSRKRRRAPRYAAAGLAVVATAATALVVHYSTQTPTPKTVTLTVYNAEPACRHLRTTECALRLARDPFAVYAEAGNSAGQVWHGDRLAATCVVTEGTLVRDEAGVTSTRWYLVGVKTAEHGWLPDVRTRNTAPVRTCTTAESRTDSP